VSQDDVGRQFVGMDLHRRRPRCPRGPSHARWCRSSAVAAQRHAGVGVVRSGRPRCLSGGQQRDNGDRLAAVRAVAFGSTAPAAALCVLARCLRRLGVGGGRARLCGTAARSRSAVSGPVPGTGSSRSGRRAGQETLEFTAARSVAAAFWWCRSRRRPQMRVVREPDPAVVDERVDHRRPNRLAVVRLPLAVQIGTDGLAVMTGMPRDRRDRPARRASACASSPHVSIQTPPSDNDHRRP